MMNQRFGNDRIVTATTGIGLQTLRNWRCKRLGPPYMKAHRRVIYDLEEVVRWLKKREVRPEE
jgi:hypothetical protein